MIDIYGSLFASLRYEPYTYQVNDHRPIVENLLITRNVQAWHPLGDA